MRLIPLTETRIYELFNIERTPDWKRLFIYRLNKETGIGTFYNAEDPDNGTDAIDTENMFEMVEG